MNCDECGTEGVAMLFAENLDCPHCGRSSSMEYFLCFSCGAVWRQHEGKVYSSVSVPSLRKSGLRNKAETTDDTDVECLICQSTAFEVEKDKFKCTNPICGFEWEVR